MPLQTVSSTNFSAATITWPQGNTAAAQTFTCQNGTGAGAAAQSLVNNTGIALSVAHQSLYAQDDYAALAGTPTVTNAAAGQFTYQFAAADVATPGTYSLVIAVTYASGARWVSLPLTLVVVQTQ